MVSPKCHSNAAHLPTPPRTAVRIVFEHKRRPVECDRPQAKGTRWPQLLDFRQVPTQAFTTFQQTKGMCAWSSSLLGDLQGRRLSSSSTFRAVMNGLSEVCA